jgi:hypothetical protein
MTPIGLREVEKSSALFQWSGAVLRHSWIGFVGALFLADRPQRVVRAEIDAAVGNRRRG